MSLCQASGLSFEFFPGPGLARKLLTPSLAKLSKQTRVVQDQKILKGIVQIVQRFAGAKEFAEQLGRNLYRLPHEWLQSLKYPRFLMGASIGTALQGIPE